MSFLTLPLYLLQKFTNAPEKGSPVASEQPEGEADLKRALPVADIHACIISLEGGRSDDGEDTKVLLISYSEAIAASQSGQGASTTRSVFFVSSKEAGSPEAEEVSDNVADNKYQLCPGQVLAGACSFTTAGFAALGPFGWFLCIIVNAPQFPWQLCAVIHLCVGSMSDPHLAFEPSGF